MYEDKTLICKDCGNEFVFSAGEQEFYAEKGFVNEPQRSLSTSKKTSCKAIKRNAQNCMCKLWWRSSYSI